MVGKTQYRFSNFLEKIHFLLVRIFFIFLSPFHNFLSKKFNNIYFLLLGQSVLQISSYHGFTDLKYIISPTKSSNRQQRISRHPCGPWVTTMPSVRSTLHTYYIEFMICGLQNKTILNTPRIQNERKIFKKLL